MIIKWIVCKVNEGFKSPFQKAQMQWKAIEACQGFIAQCRGWEQDNKNNATILSMWENQSALDRFMSEKHDDIFNSNEQYEFYQNIKIIHFKSDERQPEMANRLQDCLNTSNCLRLAHFKLNPKRISFSELSNEIEVKSKLLSDNPSAPLLFWQKEGTEYSCLLLMCSNSSKILDYIKLKKEIKMLKSSKIELEENWNVNKVN